VCLKAIVTSVQFSTHNKNRFASAYEDGCVAIWDTTKKEPVCTLKEHEGPCTCVIFSPLNNILMATGGLDSSIGLYDTSAKKWAKWLYQAYIYIWQALKVLEPFVFLTQLWFYFSKPRSTLKTSTILLPTTF
jgi:WD40 repeat protein